jgi:hypothetical protein
LATHTFNRNKNLYLHQALQLLHMCPKFQSSAPEAHLRQQPLAGDEQRTIQLRRLPAAAAAVSVTVKLAADCLQLLQAPRQPLQVGAHLRKTEQANAYQLMAARQHCKTGMVGWTPPKRVAPNNLHLGDS